MKRTLVCSLLLIVCLGQFAWAQIIGDPASITILPSNPDDGTAVTLRVSGDTRTNVSFVSGNMVVNGNTISIDITVGTGNLQIFDGWVQTFYLGVMPSGHYSVNVNVMLCQSTFYGGWFCASGSKSDAFDVQRRTITVPVEVSSTVNCTNTNGVVAMALLSTAEFDATTVDHASVRFGPGFASEAHESRGLMKRHEEDVNADGRADLVFHFRMGDAKLACEAASAMVIGTTFSGDAVEGRAALTMAGNASTALRSDALGERLPDASPGAFFIAQNYPNPFNPSTTISYSLREDAKVLLKVYDVFGREVATLVDEEQRSGAHQAVFDAGRLSSGMYFCRLQAGNFSGMQRLTLLK